MNIPALLPRLAFVIALVVTAGCEALDDGDAPVDSAAQALVAEQSHQLAQGLFIDRLYALTPNQTLSAFTLPLNTSTDVDIEIRRGAAVVASARRAGGYADLVTYRNTLANQTTQYTVRLICFRGPCGFESAIGVGSDTEFNVGSAYLNQRSFTANTGRCCVGAQCRPAVAADWGADGECYCAPSSMAMALTAIGRVRIDRTRAVATALFGTNNTEGAALRGALETYTEQTYGVTCDYITGATTMWNRLRTALRAGQAVVLRSKGFSSAGHYVRVRGYRNGAIHVDDPYGAWSSFGNWSPRNTTSTMSRSGQGRWITWSAVSSGDAGLLICR